ncbi:MAG: hypothetical protein ACKO2P_12625 [Planctomycetota bacterium]
MIRILVTGDVVSDRYLYEAQQTLVGSGVRVGATSRTVPGGAGLLAEMLRSLANKSSGRYEVTSAQPQPLDGLAASSYLVMQPLPQSRSKPKDQVWRLTQPLGVERLESVPAAAAGQATIDAATAALNDTHQIVVIDDCNLGYRRWVNRSAWPKFLRPESPADVTTARLPDWIVLKSAAPLAAGNLWHTIVSGETQHESAGDQPRQIRIGELAARTILLTSIEDLRLEGVRVDGQLSWDGAAADLLRELSEHPRMKELLRVRCLVVRFDLDGAIVIENAGTAQVATLVFDPGGTERAFARQYPAQGRVLGYQTVFTASIVDALIRNPSGSMSVACQTGLSAARRLLHHGHGPVGRDLLPGFPFCEVAQEIHSPAWKFGAIELPSTMAANWSIISGAATRPLWGLARQVALSGQSLLQNTPYLQFGKLFSIDRGEMESLRTLERLLTRYREDRKATKPLSIAAFGQPGSGKSFGVKQLAGALFDDCLLLEFNLSQFTDATALNGLFHQIRDAVLDGRLPLVFWDEFDSRDLYWLQYLLAPMQDGKFQEGQITHPIGKCIFVFAGGTRHRFEDFGEPPETLQGEEQRQVWRDDFVGQKGPDFKSRLAGYINVMGPNQNMASAEDLTFPVRRALLLRTQLGLKPDEPLNIDRGLLEAFLRIDRYLHGARSIEKIAEQVRQSSRNGMFTKSDVPPAHQLALHVNAQQFLKIMESAG